MKSRTNNQAFTLIELLIVVAIIGILAAIAVPNFMNARMRAKVAQVESNMKALSTATMAYATDHGVFPLHDHTFNCRGLTTPIAYIAQVPYDIFQNEGHDTVERRQRLSQNLGTIHPEPFYVTAAGDAAYGQVSVDGPPPPFPSLCARFKQDPARYEKARGQYPNGRYIVSLGPDYVHDPGNVYDMSNGLRSGGDIIWVVP
ncbi:MAG: prepilin-type N-terminal cleavage/methylation domain-containing protein [bacterium]